MTDTASEAAAPRDPEAQGRGSELDGLNARVEATRRVLVRLLQDVVQAEARLGHAQSSALVEANEQLVVAALLARDEAETTAQALSELSHAAERDALTQLPNRTLLRDRLAVAIAHASRHGSRLALLFLDLDNFKQINDALGHAVGDEVLKLAAQRLLTTVRAADTVGRYGGDEFVILLTEVQQPADAALIAGKVIAALAVPALIDGHPLSLAASIGIAVFPDDGRHVDALIGGADAAMYRAKRHRSGSFAFHGQAPVGDPGAAPGPQVTAASHFERTLAGHERRHAQLREANEQLVLAALSARELQAAAELARQRQALFLAAVADELRNPRAPIRVATAMLGREASDEPLMPRVQALVEQQVRQISQLVGDMFEVARGRSGSIRLACRTVDLAGIVEAAAAACRPQLAARTQRLELRLPAGALELRADPPRLAQILANLLDNASKHSHDGGRITLSVAASDDALVTTVSDEGIGISAQALPGLFEPFMQDTQAIGFNGVGLGIGLTVVRALVRAHGGEVTATSAGSGRGSQFVVTLPRSGPVAKATARAD